jgi:hypothetical protein
MILLDPVELFLSPAQLEPDRELRYLMLHY